jgi:MFS family permease
LVASAALLSLVAIGEAFFVLVLERRGEISAESVPLFFTGIGLVQIVFTMPCSRLADRIGRKRVWVAGHAVLLASYAALLLGSGSSALAPLCVLLLGVHLAATDGVSSALASLLVSAERRAGGLAIVACASGLAEIGASLSFGALWAWRGVDFSLGAFAAGTVLAILVAGATPWSDLSRAHADRS